MEPGDGDGNGTVDPEYTSESGGCSSVMPGENSADPAVGSSDIGTPAAAGKSEIVLHGRLPHIFCRGGESGARIGGTAQKSNGADPRGQGTLLLAWLIFFIQRRCAAPDWDDGCLFTTDDTLVCLAVHKSKLPFPLFASRGERADRRLLAICDIVSETCVIEKKPDRIPQTFNLFVNLEDEAVAAALEADLDDTARTIIDMWHGIAVPGRSLRFDVESGMVSALIPRPMFDRYIKRPAQDFTPISLADLIVLHSSGLLTSLFLFIMSCGVSRTDSNGNSVPGLPCFITAANMRGMPGCGTGSKNPWIFIDRVAEALPKLLELTSLGNPENPDDPETGNVFAFSRPAKDTILIRYLRSPCNPETEIRAAAAASLKRPRTGKATGGKDVPVPSATVPGSGKTQIPPGPPCPGGGRTEGPAGDGRIPEDPVASPDRDGTDWNTPPPTVTGDRVADGKSVPPTFVTPQETETSCFDIANVLPPPSWFTGDPAAYRKNLICLLHLVDGEWMYPKLSLSKNDDHFPWRHACYVFPRMAAAASGGELEFEIFLQNVESQYSSMKTPEGRRKPMYSAYLFAAMKGFCRKRGVYIPD
jgi:hypothetical protein